MISKIGLLDVKTALRDTRFRESLPPEYTVDVQKYLQNPGCSCNLPIYRKILRECQKQLLAYYPAKVEVETVAMPSPENYWKVINCHKDELEKNLRKLGPGRKSLAVARWEDQVTVVVNELNFV